MHLLQWNELFPAEQARFVALLRRLESGEFATVAELAERKAIAPSYMTRVPRLTLLAPDIVEAILDEKQGPQVTLAKRDWSRPPPPRARQQQVSEFSL